MNKFFNVVKNTSKTVFAGTTTSRVIDVAERGVQIGEKAVAVVFWLKIAAVLMVTGIVTIIVAGIVSLF